MNYFHRFVLVAGGLFLLAVPAVLFAQEHASDYVRMGTRAFEKKQYDLAISYYNSAIDEDMNYWPAYQALGTIYYIKKDYKETLKNFEKALELNPDSETLRKFVAGLRAYMHLAPLPTPTPTPVFRMPQAVNP
jgi:tetratricopeptide (TPR) repeat protein